MTTRLLLVRAAATAQTRRACFPATRGAEQVDGCAALEDAGRRAAALLASALPPVDVIWTSHARRAEETAGWALGVGEGVDAGGAAAAGLSGAAGREGERVVLLAGCDVGRWSGQALDEVMASEGDAFLSWRADPAFEGHGGESRTALAARAAALLERAAGCGRATIAAVGHGDLIRSVIVHVLHADDAAFWALGIAPASVTELSLAGPSGSWSVMRSGWTPALRGARATGAPGRAPAEVRR